jgi:hypothetical protein
LLPFPEQHGRKILAPSNIDTQQNMTNHDVKQHGQKFKPLLGTNNAPFPALCRRARPPPHAEAPASKSHLHECPVQEMNSLQFFLLQSKSFLSELDFMPNFFNLFIQHLSS